MPVFGEGSVLSVNDGANSAFVALDNVTSIDPPDETVVVADRNRLSATTLNEKAFSSRRDVGQLAFTYESGWTEFDRVEDLKNGVADKSFKIIASDNNLSFAFTGRVISNVANNIVGGAITDATATVQLTSLLTVADNSP